MKGLAIENSLGRITGFGANFKSMQKGNYNIALEDRSSRKGN